MKCLNHKKIVLFGMFSTSLVASDCGKSTLPVVTAPDTAIAKSPTIDDLKTQEQALKKQLLTYADKKKEVLEVALSTMYARRRNMRIDPCEVAFMEARDLFFSHENRTPIQLLWDWRMVVASIGRHECASEDKK